MVAGAADPREQKPDCLPETRSIHHKVSILRVPPAQRNRHGDHCREGDGSTPTKTCRLKYKVSTLRVPPPQRNGDGRHSRWGGGLWQAEAVEGAHAGFLATVLARLDGILRGPTARGEEL